MCILYIHLIIIIYILHIYIYIYITYIYIYIYIYGIYIYIYIHILHPENIEQDVVKKSVLYGKYRTVGTFDVRRESAINIIIIYVYNYIYIYIIIYTYNYIYIYRSLLYAAIKLKFKMFINQKIN